MAHKIDTSWTKADLDLLQKLWIEQKKSAKDIAEVMSGRSRNAILGKVHRMKWCRDVPSVKTKIVSKKPTPPPSFIPYVEKSGPRPKTVVPLSSLKSTECRFPFGDPKDPDFGCCGQPCLQGQPYCGEHSKITKPKYRKNTSLSGLEKCQ